MLHAEAVAGLRRQGRLGTLARALAGQAWAAVLLGDARLALTASSEARALGDETGYRSYALVADLSRAAALALRGETAAAADVLEGAESTLVPVGRQALFPMLQLARGLSALASGRPDDAYEQLVRIFAAGDVGFHPSQKFATLAHLAEAAAKSGQLDWLRPIVAELTPVAAATKSPALSYVAGLCRGAARPGRRCGRVAALCPGGGPVSVALRACPAPGRLWSQAPPRVPTSRLAFLPASSRGNLRSIGSSTVGRLGVAGAPGLR